MWTRYLPPSGFDIAHFPISPPEILDYRERNEVFESLGYWTRSSRDLAGPEGDPLQVPVVRVSHAVLPILGVEPEIGRWLRPEEDVPGSTVVLLGHDLWSSRFGGDREIVGRTITVSGRTATVAGVMPEGFAFPSARYQLIENLGFDEADPGGRAAHWLVGIGRLRPGVTLEQVEAEAEGIHAGWAEAYPHNVAHFPIFHPLADDVVGTDVRRALLLLMSAVGVVLLIAVANVANLLLARGESRQREVAVRTALGAGRGRIARQLLTESVTLATLGGALGLALAYWGTGALLAIDPNALPRPETIDVDRNVLLFTASVTLGAALLFTLAPAVRAGRAPGGALASGGRSGGSSRHAVAMRRSLIGAEAALGVIVVLAAGLIAKSFRELTSVDPGVRVDGTLTFIVSLPSARYEEEADAIAFFDELQARLASLPGAVEASGVTALPLSGTTNRNDFRIEGRDVPRDGERMWNAQWAATLPAYFAAAGVELVAGRAFTAADHRADAELVVAIGAETARVFFGGEDPLGKRVAIPLGDSLHWARIVGVVEDTRTGSLDAEVLPQAYFPHAQAPRFYYDTPRTMGFVLRTEVRPESVTGAVRAVVRELDPSLPLASVRTMEEAFRSSVARPRLIASLLGSFALVALLLAAIGIYGVVSYSVARRTREIGIRMALGAERGRVAGMVVREGTLPALVGVLVGVAVAVAGSGLLTETLFRVSPRDPFTFVALPALLLAVTLASSYLPARRATRLPPTLALTEE